MAKPRLRLVDEELLREIENEFYGDESPTEEGLPIPVNAAVAASVLSDAAIAYAPRSA